MIDLAQKTTRTMRGRPIAVLAAAIWFSAALLCAAPPALAADGSGTSVVTPTSVNAGSTGNTLTFTFTAAETMDSGSVRLTVPANWSAPQGVNGAAGYVTASSGGGIIANIEDALDSASNWTAQAGDCNAGLSADTTTFHEGAASLSCKNSASTNNTSFYRNLASSQDWSGYTNVAFWIRSSSNLNANHLRFVFAANTNVATPIASLVLPAVTANSWTYVNLPLSGTRTSVASFGFLTAGATAQTNDINIDDVLLGPGLPQFLGGGVVSTRFLQLAAGQTRTLTYGAGGGASGASAPASGETSVFTVQTRVTDGGTVTPIASSPLVTVFNPAPTTTTISPTSKSAGAAVFTLTVNGTNFVPASVVQFNGSSRTTAYVSPTQLTASIPASDIVSAGTFNITVFNPTPGGGTSGAQVLTVAADTTAPAAVSNLALSSPTTSSMLLTWTAPGDDNGAGTAALYDIRYSTSPIVSDAGFNAASQVLGEPAPTLAGTVQSMTVTGLSANTTYFFAMKTQDEVPNISALSNLPSLSTSSNPDVTPPATTTTLSLSSPTTSSLVLAWTAPGDDGAAGTAALYDIRYSTSPIVSDAGFNSASQVLGEPAPTVAGTVQSMTVTGLSANTTYYFAMKTQDEVPNISALSNVPSLSTSSNPDVTPPAAITTLALSNPSTSSMLLTWTAPGDDNGAGTAALYDIRYSTSPIVSDADFAAASLVSGEPAPSAGGTVQSMTVFALSANTTYFFAMKTQDEVPNISALSNAPSLSTASNPDVTPPATITTLVLSNPTTSTLDLTWTAPGDDGNVGTANLYDVRYSTSPIVTAADFTAASQVSGEPFPPSVPGSNQTMTVTGLSANTRYYFAMKTQDEVPNVSAVSNVASIFTAANPDSTPPAAIANLALSNPSTSTMVLAWTAPGDDGAVGTATLYRIRYSTSPIVTEADFTAASQVSGEPTPLVAGTAQAMTVTGLSANTTYYFAMKAQDEVPNISAISNLPSLSTLSNPDVAPPAPVTTLSLSNPTTSSISVTWTAPGDDNGTGTASLYDIRYSTTPIVTEGDFTTAFHVVSEPAPAAAGTVQSLTVTGLSANTLYFFAMKTQDEVPNISSVSNKPSLSTLAAPDVTPPSTTTTLALSNPSTSSIVLNWTAPGDDGVTGTASLYDIRYATTQPITDADFALASQVSGEPSPAAAGSAQAMTVTGLSANTTYFFAMKTQDEAPNISAVSNIPSLSTLASPDVVAPAAVTDLALHGPSTSSLAVLWTSPGDDGNSGTAASYDIRYSTSPIVTDADFTAAAQVTGEPVPQVAGSIQAINVTGLSANTTYYFAMKSQDEAPNISALSNVASASTAANPDIVAPAAITNLALSSPTSSSMTLAWTAPGDDGSVGTAAQYDIRYSSSPIVTDADFTAAAAVSGKPLPLLAGSPQSLVVGGLASGTRYYFAMKTQDEAPNISAISNVPSLSTSGIGGGGGTEDTSAPAAVTNLALSGATADSMTLTWTAPGDDGNNGTAFSYDIRYSTSPILTGADFTLAPQVSGEPAPAVAGTVQSMTVNNLSSDTTYYFVLKARDEVPNISPVSNLPSLKTAVSSGGGGGGGGSDTTPPVSSIISVASITKDSAIITWDTNENADSLARFGLTDPLGGTANDAALVIHHVVPLVGLASGTTYRYSVCSKDAAGNQGCSGEFTFATLPADAPSPTYGAAEELLASPTINADKALVAPAAGPASTCVSGTLMKLPNDGDPATQADSAVYYCGADGKRYVFPDAGTYRSWYPDFSGVVIADAAALAAMPLGGNVTYRPGSRMIKVQTDPKVYAIARGGVLRWVTTEAVAESLYGLNWKYLVSDVSDAFFINYAVGAPILAADVAPVAPAAPPPGTPAACTTATTFTEFLSVGSNDPQVLPLQVLLACLGYFPAGTDLTGHFGPATESAVKAFQSANGIEPLGYVGPATREALNRYVVP